MRITFHRLDAGPRVEFEYKCPGCGETFTAHFEPGAAESSDHNCPAFAMPEDDE